MGAVAVGVAMAIICNSMEQFSVLWPLFSLFKHTLGHKQLTGGPLTVETL